MITHLLLLAVVTTVSTVPPDPPTPPPYPTTPPSPSLPTWSAVYDVRDLIAPDEAEAPPVETGLPGLELGDVLRLPAVDEVIEWIQAEVAPGTWDRRVSRGGSSLHELRGNLIITTSPANHERIEAMLTELRAEASLRVLIDVLVVADGEDPVELPEDAAMIEGPVVDGHEGASVALLQPGQADALRAAIDERGDDVMTAPRLLVRNGRSASVIVGSERALELPIADDPREVMTTVHPLDGVALLVVARVTEDRRALHLGLSARTAELTDDDPTLELAGAAVTHAVVTDGGAIALRMPRTYIRLVAARFEEGELVEIVRKAQKDGGDEGDVLIVVQPTLMVGEQ